MNPFPFEELQKILELKDTELETDELIFNSVITTVEKQLGFSLEDNNYNELQTVRDCKVYTDYDNITEMINIIDMNTKQRVPHCVIDGRRIFLLDTKLEGHVLFLNYNAGFTTETLPADLKEVIIKLFLIKKKEFIKQRNNEDLGNETFPADLKEAIIKMFILKRKDFLKNINNEENSEFEIPKDIQTVINIYRRKTL